MLNLLPPTPPRPFDFYDILLLDLACFLSSTHSSSSDKYTFSFYSSSELFAKVSTPSAFSTNFIFINQYILLLLPYSIYAPFSNFYPLIHSVS